MNENYMFTKFIKVLFINKYKFSKLIKFSEKFYGIKTKKKTKNGRFFFALPTQDS